MISHSDLTLLLDESIKIQDKEFFDQCLDLARSDGFRIRYHIEYDMTFPILIIGSRNYLNELTRSCDNDIRIQFNFDNLSLFSLENSHIDNFEFNNFDELYKAWPIFVKLLTSHLKALETQLLGLHKKSILNILKRPLELAHSTYYQNFERGLLSLSSGEFNIEEINEILHKSFEKQYSLVTLSSIRLQALNYFLPIPYKDDQMIFLTSTREFTDIYLYKLLYDYFLRELNLVSYERKLEEVSELKNLIPEPVLILNSEGDAVIYNNAFTKLSYSLKLCSQLKDGEQLEIQDSMYKVVIQQTKEGDKAYYFFPIDAYISMGTEPTTQELGIISSSLAHELNNPLGGILAAINVLELDVTDSELATQLFEMKQGVLRCKNLVEMFLGFSRLDSQIHLTYHLKIKQIVQQSFDLIRFRMVETNMNFNFSYKHKNDFDLTGNPYVLSMVFYLLWSELVTAYSRQKLVGLELGDHLNISIEENQKYISIRFFENVALEDLIFKSKLFIHLCDLGQIKVESREGLIQLSIESK